MYSVEANVPEKAGEGKPRRSYLLGPSDPLVSSTDPSISTLWDNWNNGVRVSGAFTLFFSFPSPSPSDGEQQRQATSPSLARAPRMLPVSSDRTSG